MNEVNKDVGIKVSIISIIVNLMLSVFKLIAGIFGHSSAMISDAIHSASDVFSTFIVICGIKMSQKEADNDHRYGHEKFECIASIVLAVCLAFTGLTLGINSIKSTLSGNVGIIIPSTLAIIAAISSIIVKELMFQYTKYVANNIKSNALLADAWHHRSDALSSIGALVGIVLSKVGFPMMDAVASLAICFCIIKVALDIFIDGTDKIVDKSCAEDVENDIRNVITSRNGVVGIDDLKTRVCGNNMYVDVEISVCGETSFVNAHHIAEDVHHSVEDAFCNCKHCMVHTNPK